MMCLRDKRLHLLSHDPTEGVGWFGMCRGNGVLVANFASDCQKKFLERLLALDLPAGVLGRAPEFVAHQ